MRKFVFLFLIMGLSSNIFGQSSNLILQGDNITKCQGDTLVLNGITGAIYSNYRWENTILPGVTISTADSLVLTNVSQFGEFYALLVDSNGITVDDTIFAIEFASPEVNLGPDTIICSGDTITLQDSVISSPLYSYQWNTGATSSSIQVSTPGIYRLRITAPFPNPCFSSDTILVNLSPALQLQNQGEFDVCQGESLNVSAILDSGGISPYVFQWSPAGLFNDPNAQNTILNTSNSTTVSIKVTDRNGIGCSDSISIPVNIRPNVQANVDFTDSTICLGNSLDLFATGNSGTPGNSGYSFNWMGPNLINPGSNPVTANPVQNTTYLVVVSDSFNCDDSAFVNISIDSFEIDITNGDSAFICSGQAVQINMNIVAGDGNETFLWSPDNGSVSNINIAEPQISGQGTYTVLATSSTGCTSSDMVSIGVAELPSFSFDPISSEYCPRDILSISGQGSLGSGGGYRYIYTDGTIQLNTDSSQVFSTQAGSLGMGIAVTLLGYVIDANNCRSLNDTLNFDVINVPQTTLTGDSTAFVNIPANFTISGAETADSIFWDWGDGSVEFDGNSLSHTFQFEGNYGIATVLYFRNCVDTNYLTVTVNPELTENIIYIPKAFSPNANNLENQTLKVYGENIIEEDFSFEVFTAWGDLVYESTDLDEIRNIGWVPEAISGTVLVVNVSGKFINGENFSVQQTVNFIQ
ncbi:MAG: hypothetical protein RH860_05230 [Cytophagales bacterium]